MTDIGELITVLTPIVLGLGQMYLAFRLRQQDNTRDAARAENDQRFTAIDGQLTTLNGGTVGSFTSDNETRRIEALQHDDRTQTEQSHLDAAAPREVKLSDDPDRR